MSRSVALVLMLLLFLGVATSPVGGAKKKRQKQKRDRRRAQHSSANSNQEWYRAEGLGALEGYNLPAAALQCNVERVPAAEMTAEKFRDEFDLNRPVVLSGAIDAWSVPTAPFRRSALLELADRTDATVMAGGSSSIPKHRGEGHRRVNLRWLVESSMGPPRTGQRPAPESLCAFDRGEFFRTHPTLRQQLVWPAAVYPAIRSGGGDQTYFSLGGYGSGVQFHYHADGWSLQYFGRKAWWFFPPGQTPLPTYPPAVSIAYWVEHMLPSLLRDGLGGLVHCIIEEGEWLYVPEGWYHATFALEDSVSVAAQLGGVGPARLGQQAVTAVQRLWSELWLLSGNNEVTAAIKKSNEIMALAPDNREVLYQRALLLSRQAAVAGTAGSTMTGDGRDTANTLLSEAVAGFKTAIDANPRQAEPYNNYAALIMAGWQHQQEHGEVGALTLRGLKSVRAALQTATGLNPTNANAWENLALLHDYDAQRKLALHTQQVNKKGKKGKKGNKGKGKNSTPRELEVQLSELAAAAAQARSNARAAEAILRSFSDP